MVRYRRYLARLHSKSFMLEFFELYKKYPCVWQLKHKDYSNMEKKNRAYKKLFKKCQSVYRDMAIGLNEVIDYIDSFRNAYWVELMQVYNAEENGKCYKPKLWYFRRLKFLNNMDPGKPGCTIKETVENLFKVFAWVAVFVLPLNAALNPVLYTLSTAPFLTPALIKFRRSCKLNHYSPTCTLTRKYGSARSSEFSNNSVTKRTSIRWHSRVDTAVSEHGEVVPLSRLVT